jgi:hypothetical protein
MSKVKTRKKFLDNQVWVKSDIHTAVHMKITVLVFIYFCVGIYFTFRQIFTDMEAVIEYIKIHENVQSICHNLQKLTQYSVM